MARKSTWKIPRSLRLISKYYYFESHMIIAQQRKSDIESDRQDELATKSQRTLRSSFSIQSFLIIVGGLRLQNFSFSWNVFLVYLLSCPRSSFLSGSGIDISEHQSHFDPQTSRFSVRCKVIIDDD